MFGLGLSMHQIPTNTDSCQQETVTGSLFVILAPSVNIDV